MEIHLLKKRTVIETTVRFHGINRKLASATIFESSHTHNVLFLDQQFFQLKKRPFLSFSPA